MIADEIWQQDLSKDMLIGASTEGYDRVGLRCGAEKMTVELRTTEDFSGVIYTQGSFHSREPSCFLDPVRGRSFTMNIPLNKCDTERVSENDSTTERSCLNFSPRNIFIRLSIKLLASSAKLYVTSHII